MKFRVPVEKLAYSDVMSASNSCVLLKGIKLAAPAYSKFPHILVSLFVKPSRIIIISHKDPMIDVF